MRSPSLIRPPSAAINIRHHSNKTYFSETKFEVDLILSKLVCGMVKLETNSKNAHHFLSNWLFGFNSLTGRLHICLRPNGPESFKLCINGTIMHFRYRSIYWTICACLYTTAVRDVIQTHLLTIERTGNINCKKNRGMFWSIGHFQICTESPFYHYNTFYTLIGFQCMVPVKKLWTCLPLVLWNTLLLIFTQLWSKVLLLSIFNFTLTVSSMVSELKTCKSKEYLKQYQSYFQVATQTKLLPKVFYLQDLYEEY